MQNSQFSKTFQQVTMRTPKTNKVMQNSQLSSQTQFLQQNKINNINNLNRFIDLDVPLYSSQTSLLFSSQKEIQYLPRETDLENLKLQQIENYQKKVNLQIEERFLKQQLDDIYQQPQLVNFLPQQENIYQQQLENIQQQRQVNLRDIEQVNVQQKVFFQQQIEDIYQQLSFIDQQQAENAQNIDQINYQPDSIFLQQQRSNILQEQLEDIEQQKQKFFQQQNLEIVENLQNIKQVILEQNNLLQQQVENIYQQPQVNDFQQQVNDFQQQTSDFQQQTESPLQQQSENYLQQRRLYLENIKIINEEQWEALRQAISSNETQLEALQQAISSNETQLEALQQTISSNETQREALQQTISENIELFEALNEQNNLLISEVEKTKLEVEILIEEQNIIRFEYDKNNLQLQRLNAEQSQINQELDYLESKQVVFNNQYASYLEIEENENNQNIIELKIARTRIEENFQNNKLTREEFFIGQQISLRSDRLKLLKQKQELYLADQEPINLQQTAIKLSSNVVEDLDSENQKQIEKDLLSNSDQIEKLSSEFQEQIDNLKQQKDIEFAEIDKMIRFNSKIHNFLDNDDDNKIQEIENYFQNFGSSLVKSSQNVESNQSVSIKNHIDCIDSIQTKLIQKANSNQKNDPILDKKIIDLESTRIFFELNKNQNKTQIKTYDTIDEAVKAGNINDCSESFRKEYIQGLGLKTKIVENSCQTTKDKKIFEIEIMGNSNKDTNFNNFKDNKIKFKLPVDTNIPEFISNIRNKGFIYAIMQIEDKKNNTNSAVHNSTIKKQSGITDFLNTMQNYLEYYNKDGSKNDNLKDFLAANEYDKQIIKNISANKTWNYIEVNQSLML